MLKKALVLLVLILLSNPAQAAKGFGYTYGVSETDAVFTTNTITLASKYSYFIWMWLNGVGGSDYGQLFTLGISPITQVYMNGSINQMALWHQWTTDGGGWTWGAPSVGKWVPFGLTYDSSSSANNPIVYMDGTAQTVTIATAPAGSSEPFTYKWYVGNCDTCVLQFDGKLARATLWNGVILSSNEMSALARGVLPMQIRSSARPIYLPMTGDLSTAPDWGPDHVATTTVGTTNVSDPPAMALPQ